MAVGTAAMSGNAAAATQGGRAQVDGSVRRNAPFTIRPDGTDVRNASCMSANSAIQTYVIHSATPCRANDLRKVAIGPARESC